jgi:hypothetical protein
MRSATAIAAGIVSIVGAALLLWGAVYAEELTLASVLDKGAKKLSAAELKTEITSGRVGTPEGFSYKSDGSLTGTDSGYDVVGEWQVDADGRQCVDWRIQKFPGVGGGSFCRYWFKLGDSTYILDAQSDSDRSQSVRKAESAAR